MYVINNSFSKYEHCLEYSWIDKIVEDSANEQYMMLYFKFESKPKGLPTYMFLKVDDRDTFIDFIEACFRTDNITESGKFKKFKRYSNTVFRPNTNDKNDKTFNEELKNEKIENFNINLDILYLDTGSMKKEVIKNYYFYINRVIEDKKNMGQFVVEWTNEILEKEIYKHDFKFDLKVDVNDPITTYDLQYQNNKMDEETYARSVVMNLIRNTLEDKSSSDMPYYRFLKNEAFMKRLTLSNDTSQVTGHVIWARTCMFNYMVVVIRRKFIPPLCDMGQDILLQAAARIDADTESTGRLDFYKMTMDTAHSINSCKKSYTVYHDLIQLKVDSLTMDEETMSYCMNYLRLVPINFLDYSKDIFSKSIEFVCYILNKFDYDTQEKDTIFQYILEVNAEIWNSNFQRWVNTMDGNADKLEKIRLSYRKNLNDRMKNPGEYESIIKQLMGIVEDQIIHLNNDEKRNIKKIWSAKIARYLAWLIDGGLLQRRLNMSILIKKLMDKNEETQYNILSYLLYFRQKDKEFETKKAFHTYLMQLEYDKVYLFNERMMILMLTTEVFVYRKFEKENFSTKYDQICKLILLGKEYSIKLKCAVLKSISSIYKQMYVNFGDEIVIKILIEYLDNYEKNQELGNHAIECFKYLLCNAKKDDQTIYQYFLEPRNKGISFLKKLTKVYDNVFLNYVLEIIKKFGSAVKYIDLITSEDLDIGFYFVKLLVLNLDCNLRHSVLNDKIVKDILEILFKLCQSSPEFATRLRIKLMNERKFKVAPEKSDMYKGTLKGLSSFKILLDYLTYDDQMSDIAFKKMRKEDMTFEDRIAQSRIFIKWKVNQFLAYFFKEMRSLKNEDTEWYEYAVEKFNWFLYYARESEKDFNDRHKYFKPPGDPQRPIKTQSTYQVFEGNYKDFKAVFWNDLIDIQPDADMILIKKRFSNKQELGGGANTSFNTNAFETTNSEKEMVVGEGEGGE